MQADSKVDVVIPVYNAFPYVEKCVRSITEYIDDKIDKIIIYNDCSTKETAEQLETLKFEKLKVVHGDVNLGFGGAVNTAFQYATQPYVLVLNSDTEASDDFLGSLVNLLDDNHNIAAVNPVQDSKQKNKYQKYADNNGFVRNYQLSGYAFLIRKHVFDEIGGFKKEFGRGYFEDNALARDICKKGYNTGLCITSVLSHAASKSFDTSKIMGMMKKNEKIFEDLYPESKSRVLVIGQGISKVVDDIEHICKDGGRVYLYGYDLKELRGWCPRIEVITRLLGLLSLINRYIIRKNRRRNGINDIWITSGAGFFEKRILSMLSSFYKIDLRCID